MAPPRQAQVPRILDRLLGEKKITREIYDAAVNELRRHAVPVDEALMEVGLPEADVLKALASVYRCRFVSTERLAKAQIDRATLELVPPKVVERYNVVPILMDAANATLSVVLADPDNVQALEEVKVVSRVRNVAPLVARAAAVNALIRKIYHRDPAAFAQLERAQQNWPQMMDVFERQTNEGLGAQQLKKLQHGGNVFDQSGGVMLDLEAPRPTAQTPPPVQPAKIPSLAPAAPHMPLPPTPSLQMPAVPAPVAKVPTARPVHQPEPVEGVSNAAWLETLNVLVSLLENNRPDLRGHSAHVARLTRKFCERLGLDVHDAEELVAAAYMHDLGKNSNYHLTALNVSEYDGHKVAAQKSYLTPSRLMAGVKLPEATVRALNHMYERFDGKGFPDGLSQKDIPLGARVIAITDTYADLTQNPRNPYRKSLRPIEASDVLAKYKGAIFDNNLVDIFRHVVTGDDLKAKLLANRKSALVIDADPEETTVLELRMIEQGFEVKIARTSDQAMKALSEGEFELVISEVDLQPIDGFQLFERARQIDSVRNGIWVFLSSNADRESIDKGFALGATDYVEKPVKAELLVAKLRKVVEQGSQQRGGAARGVSGSLEEMGFPELVQILAQGRKTGALKIRAGSESGELHFVTGEVWGALWGKLRGEEAFYAMCKLRSGEFVLDPNFKAAERALGSSAEGLLLEGMRRLDEDARSVPPAR